MAIMDALGRLAELRALLSSLAAHKGLRIFPTRLPLEARAVGAALGKGLDMGRAIQCPAAPPLRAESIVSYDKRLEGLGMPRGSPEEPI